MNIITDERCVNYAAPGHPERPARISRTLARLRGETGLAFTWRGPLPVTDTPILRAHARAHLDRVRAAEHDFDGDTPVFPKIHEHAERSVGAGLHALTLARRGELAFSLIRPPGHHATRDRAMGFCYLNNAAIAVLEAVQDGKTRVAVFDFDVHHGNGTEAILRNQPRTAFYSIHQYPCYPGTGTEHVGDNCFNYPVAPQTPRDQYRKVFTKALEDLKKFKPDLVAVSAGFDAYARDPIAQETLESEDFHWLGEAIRKLGVPAFSLLEGGYSDDLPDLILAYLKGWAGK
jgi:acetoin utilization deacetylase AcuC-like enzyme